jgi:hypothetical protein
MPILKLKKFNLVSLSLVLELFLNSSQVFARGGENADKENLEPNTAVFNFYSPTRTHRNRPIHLSPHSDLQNVIYLFHDLETKELSSLEKVDFQNREATVEEFRSKIMHLEAWVAEQRRLGRLLKFHRYVGLVTQGKDQVRSALDRFREHGIACNSSTDLSEKRLCLGLSKSAEEKKIPEMVSLIHGAHPSQIRAFEAYFIQLFGGLEDLGWNSNPGDLGAFQEFFKVTLSAKRKILF